MGLGYPTEPNSPFDNLKEISQLSNLERWEAIDAPQDGRLIKAGHAKVMRMLGDTLTLGESSAWLGFSAVAAIRLNVVELKHLAFAAMLALDPAEAADVAECVLDNAGYPLPAFLSPMNEARDWASFASRPERKAYALASYEALSPEDQAAFRAHISKQEVSA